MAAITRLRLRPPSPITCPSLLTHSPSSVSNPCSSRIRKVSFYSPLCYKSDNSIESSPETASSPSIVGDLLDYLNESWTQFHATAEAKRQLVAGGFHLLNENDEWDLKPGGRYFFTRNMSCLIAFAVGENFAGALWVVVFTLLLLTPIAPALNLSQSRDHLSPIILW